MFAIISAEHGECAVEDVLATQMLREELKKSPYQYREVTGCWTNSTEVAFQVIKPIELDSREFEEHLGSIAFGEFDQEAILIVFDSFESFLEFNPRTPDRSISTEHIGKWVEIEPHEAVALPGWTSYNGQFYTTK